MSDYRAFRDQNLAQVAALRSTEQGCRDRGALVSDGIAVQADALSCQAQLDASRMDAEMAELGGKCQGAFHEIHGLQMRLRKRLGHVQRDLEAGTLVHEASLILQEDCRSEILSTRSLVRSFLELERQVLEVEERSFRGEVDYGKFKEMAVKLRDATKERGVSCGELVSAMGVALSSSEGGGAPARRGLGERGADISGTDRLDRGSGISGAGEVGQRGGRSVRHLGSAPADPSPPALSGRSAVGREASTDGLNSRKPENRAAGARRSPARDADASSGAALWRLAEDGAMELVRSKGEPGTLSAADLEVGREKRFVADYARFEPAPSGLEEQQPQGDLFLRVRKKHREHWRPLGGAAGASR